MGFYRGPQIVTNGLVMYLDAGNPKSYPGTGTTWFNRSGSSNNGTLTNGPTFNSANGGSIVFDGIDDYIGVDNGFNLPNWSYSFWYSTNYETNLLSAIYLNLGGVPQISQQLGVFSGLRSITLDSNNNLYTGTFGNYQYRDGNSFCAQKINNNGTLSSFNFNFIPSSAVAVDNMLIKSDDSVGYIAGTNISTLSRFNTTTGQITLNNNVINATISNKPLFLDESNNHIYLGGTFTLVGGVSYGRFARFDMNTLVVDSSFNTSIGFDSIPTSAAIDSNNKIYVLGTFTTYKGVSSRGIIRLNYDGTTDTSFNVGSGFNTITTSLRIIIDSNNKPIITGNFTSYNGTAINRIVRLNTDGTIDTSFNVGAGLNGNVADMVYDVTNEKIFCTGSFTTYNNISRNYTVAINMDGSVDNTFSIGTGFNISMSAIALQTDGKIIIGEGDINVNRTFTRTYNGYQFSSFIRLNSNGSIDSTFDAGLGYTQGTYRNALTITYKTPLGVPQTLSNLGNFPGGGGRRNLGFFQDYYNNKWHQFTITKGTDETYRVYSDGILTGTLTVPVGSNTSIEFNRILNREKQSNSMLYNRALSAQEILQNFNATKSRYGL